MKKTIKILSALGTTILGASAISFTVSATNSVNINKKNEIDAFYDEMLELSKDKERLNSLVEDFDEFEIVKSNLKIHKWISELKFYTTGSLDEDILNLSKLKITEKQKLFMLSNLLDKYEFYIKNKTSGVKYSASPEIYKIIPYAAKTTKGQTIVLNGQKFSTIEGINDKLKTNNVNDNYLIQRGNDIWTINDYKTWDDVTTIEWSTERLLVEWLKIINDKKNDVVEQTKEILNGYLNIDVSKYNNSSEPIYGNDIKTKMDLLDSFISDITTDFDSKTEAYTSLIISSVTTSISSSISAFRGFRNARVTGYRNTFRKIAKDPLFIRVADKFNDFLDFSASSFFGIKGIEEFNKNNIENYKRNELINNDIKKISSDNQYFIDFRNKKLNERLQANNYLNPISISTDILSTVLSFASIIGQAGSVIPFVSIGVGLLSIILSTLNIIFNVDSGNGYTMHENWHDHGLNDWRFQMKSNRENLVRIALDHSNGFKDNIQWTVTDGWFTFPELYIKNLTNQKETFLSPGTSFNFGNKIQYKGKSWKK